MTKEGILKHRKVFDAWLEGAEIEFKDNILGWRKVIDPSFEVNSEYRVKFLLPIKKGTFVVSRDTGNIVLVSNVFKDMLFSGVSLQTGQYSTSWVITPFNVISHKIVAKWLHDQEYKK